MTIIDEKLTSYYKDLATLKPRQLNELLGKMMVRQLQQASAENQGSVPSVRTFRSNLRPNYPSQ